MALKGSRGPGKGRRTYSHMTASGDFDPVAHRTGAAMERARRGLKPFTRNEVFSEVMSSENRRREKAARSEGTERGFQAGFDSALGMQRKKRQKRGHAGSRYSAH